MTNERSNLPAKQEDKPRTAIEDKLLNMATTPEEKAYAYKQLTRLRQSQMLRATAAQISALSWGKDLQPETQLAVARYCLMTGTDPVRHWEILGGKLYDKAELWLDFVASREDYKGYEFEHINDDKRLTKDQREHRRALRALYNMPEDTKGCCVVKIWRAGYPAPFIGVNHAGNRKGFNAVLGREADIKDPIGEQDPGKTAFTRAFRKAAKTGWPLWFARHPITDEDAGAVEVRSLEHDTRHEAERLLTEEREARKLPDPTKAPPVELGGGLSVRAADKNTPVFQHEDGAYGMSTPQDRLRESIDDAVTETELRAEAEDEAEEERIRQEDLELQ